VQGFTAGMPLLTATSAFGLGRRRWSFPQQPYLHCLRICILYLSSVRESVHEYIHRNQWSHDICNARIYNKKMRFAFSALTLLVGWQEGHPPVKN